MVINQLIYRNGLVMNMIQNYEWPKWYPSSRTHLYVTKRDFRGEFETLHFLIKIADASKWTKIRNFIAYFVVWNICPHNADKQ